MKFCTNCGKATNDEKELFCTDCGQVFKNEEKSSPQKNQQTFNVAEESSTPPNPPTQKMSKKKKYAFITILSLFLLLVIGHFTIKTMISPEKTIKAMNDDFTSNKPKDFLKHFNYDQKISADAEGYYDYIDKQSWSTVRQSLLDQTQTLEKGGFVDPITDSDGNDMIRIVEKPLVGGLYNKVSFEIIPLDLLVAIEFDNNSSPAEDYSAVFKHDKTTKKLTLDEWTSVGSYLPGSYDWTTEIQNQFGDLPFEGSMLLGENISENEEKMTLALDAEFLTIESNNTDAILFINGKSTDTKISDKNEIGPLKLDSSVTIQAKVTEGGKEYKTKKVKAEKSVAQLNFDYIEDQEKQDALNDMVSVNEYSLENLFLSYRQAHEDTLNTGSNSYISGYIASSTLAEDFERLAKADPLLKENNHTNNILSITAIDENNYSLLSEEKYTFYFDDYRIEEWKLSRTYTIEYIDESFKITNAEIDQSTRQNQITRTSNEAKEAMEDFEDNYGMDYESYFSDPDYYDYENYIYDGYENVSD